jgi:chromosome segregation ATPase
MSEITPEKTYQLLEKLAEYVMTEVSTKTEVNQKITQVDEKIDKLAVYVMNEVPTKREMNARFEQVDRRFEQIDQQFDRIEQRFDRVENDVKLILDGMDIQVKDIEILKTEQTAMKSGLGRIEKRVKKLEKVH